MNFCIFIQDSLTVVKCAGTTFYLHKIYIFCVFVCDLKLIIKM